MAVSCIVDSCLPVVYWCPQQPRPTYLTPPSHPAPSAYQPIYLLTQKTLLLILTSPGTTAKSFFLGGGEYPVWIYEVHWGIPGYSCMRVATTGGMWTWNGHCGHHALIGLYPLDKLWKCWCVADLPLSQWPIEVHPCQTIIFCCAPPSVCPKGKY